MKITCQSCQSKYTVSDEKVQGKTVKIKCRKCGATILVNSGGVTTSGAGVADPASVSTGSSADGGASYLVNVTDGDQRSMSLGEVVAAYNTSEINAETYVWADGMADWTPLGQVESIISALNGPAAVAPEAAAPMAAAAPAAQEHRAAAKRETGRAAQDLFSAKPPEDVATSAPTYNNGASRPAAAASLSAVASSTGHREENSMLFSLSALTAKVGNNSPSSAPRATTARDREDSGIIDLKALAAAAAVAPAPTPAAAAFLPDVGLFPLGAPPVSAPIAAPPVVTATTPPPKSKAPLFIGVGAVVAVGAIIGAFMLMKGPPPAPPAAAVADTAPTATPTPSATATVAATASAAPTDSAAASPAPSASADAKVAKGGRAPSGGFRPAGGRPAGAAPAAAAPAPAAAPRGRGNCGCAAGDLLCAMKCSAGK